MMRRFRHSVRVARFPTRPILLAIGLLLPLGAPSAQSTATPRLTGRVVDRTSHAGVAGAQIVVDATGRLATSDSTGAYALPDLPRGRVELTVRATRFVVAHVALQLVGTGDWEHDIVLDSTGAGFRAGSVATLGVVTVTARAPEVNYRLRGFELRRATGRGQYLTDAEIQNSGASNVQDAVRGMRGVDFDCGGTAFGGCRVRMARAPEHCLPEYIVDGQIDNYFGPRTSIRDVIALELYTGPADVPGDFAGHNSGCGVIVLWTRSGPAPVRAQRDSGGAAG